MNLNAKWKVNQIAFVIANQKKKYFFFWNRLLSFSSGGLYIWSSESSYIPHRRIACKKDHVLKKRRFIHSMYSIAPRWGYCTFALGMFFLVYTVRRPHNFHKNICILIYSNIFRTLFHSSSAELTPSVSYVCVCLVYIALSAQLQSQLRSSWTVFFVLVRFLFFKRFLELSGFCCLSKRTNSLSGFTVRVAE